MSQENSEDLEPTGKYDLSDGTAMQTDRFEGERLANRYILEKLLDRGGFGGVYRGIDSRFDSKVAIKLLTPPFSDNEFRREAKLNRAFRHPNVVEVYDYGIDRGLAFIVMEYLQGDRVDQLLHTRYDRLFPFELLDKFVHEITSALQNAHEQSLVHRDLKPQNVMLIDDGKPTERFILLDFGIAAQTDGSSTLRNSTRDTAFTPNYGAPERFTGEPTDLRTDIYSFGIILYELVTGCLPFQGDRLLALMNAVQNDPPPPFAEVAPHVQGCVQIETLVMRCLEKDPRDRPQTMGELREEYFAAREAQIPVQADRDRFSDQWKQNVTPSSTTELHFGLDDNEPTLDAPETGDVTAIDTDRTELPVPDSTPFTATQQVELEKALSNQNRRLLYTIVAVFGVAAALVVTVVVNWNRSASGPAVNVPAAPWFPSEDFRPAEGAQLHKGLINGLPVYDTIERVVEGESKPVTFLLVVDKFSPAKPFYIMQDEVWTGLYRRFAEENRKSIGRDKKGGPGIWEEGAMVGAGSQGTDNPRLPVVNISAHEAHRCASWLSGRLPTVEEWNTAAGYYVWMSKSDSDETKAEFTGPFRGKWPATKNQQARVSIDAEAPLEVGTALDDVSTPFGCRDMAGNVEEMTCILEGAVGRVPISKPDSNTYVLLRGKCYRDPAPYRFTDFNEPSLQAYKEPSPFVGFRVVIEIKKAAE